MMRRRSGRRGADDVGRRADEVLLARRLGDLGLVGVRVAVHENRTVMVSLSRGTLRIHRGYAYASDRVLAAIVTFLRDRSRAARDEAERELLDFPVDRFAVPDTRRRRRDRNERRLIGELRRRHSALNERYFGGTLAAIPFRLSTRMRTQLGELVLDGVQRAVEIGMSRRHIERDGWVEAEKTLLHEMIHQWQAETGEPVDHGSGFRRMARRIGIEPTARRDLALPPAVVEVPLFPEE